MTFARGSLACRARAYLALLYRVLRQAKACRTFGDSGPFRLDLKVDLNQVRQIDFEHCFTTLLTRVKGHNSCATQALTTHH